MSVLYLSEQDVLGLVTMPLAVEAVEAGLKKMALEEAFSPPRVRTQTDHAMLHVLAASAKSLGVIGYKAYTTTKTSTRFHVTIYDAKTGEMLALMRADHLGRYRTGAASGVATKYLAAPDADVLGLVGTGGQARTQLLGVCAVRPIKRVRVFGRDEGRRTAFADEMGRAAGVEVEPVDSAEAAVKGAQVVCTATTSRDPVFFGAWLTPGVHLNAVGANFLGKSEIDAETVRRADLIVIDSKEQGRQEAGDIQPAVEKEEVSWADVVELGRIVANRHPGRETPEQVTLFKSLGIGLEDISLAIRLYKLARERGVGTELEL